MRQARQAAAKKPSTLELDLTDVKRRVGQEVGGGQLFEPCSVTDIRRWVMAMDFPNPIHWDHQFAEASRFGDALNICSPLPTSTANASTHSQWLRRTSSG